MQGRFGLQDGQLERKKKTCCTCLYTRIYVYDAIEIFILASIFSVIGMPYRWQAMPRVSLLLIACLPEHHEIDHQLNADTDVDVPHSLCLTFQRATLFNRKRYAQNGIIGQQFKCRPCFDNLIGTFGIFDSSQKSIFYHCIQQRVHFADALNVCTDHIF